MDKDSQFFKENKLIDYSLLLGVYEKPLSKGILKNKTLADPKEKESLMVYTSADGQKMYYLCIIDFLTSFTWLRKKAEYLFKKTFQGGDISCVPPDHYSKRFFNFMKNGIENKGESEENDSVDIVKSKMPRITFE